MEAGGDDGGSLWPGQPLEMGSFPTNDIIFLVPFSAN